MNNAARQAVLEAMRTLRSVRCFRSDPVPLEVARRVIEAATWAPSARNAQPWFFLVVQDSRRKAAIGELYLRAWRQAQALTASAGADRDIATRPGYAAMMRAVDHLATHLADVPLLILACLDTAQLGPMADGRGTILAPQSAYASIFPAVQNLMLAARSFGLGSTLTTIHNAVESEVRTALDIPQRIHVAALIPLGYPARPFAPVKRRPAGEVTFLNRWGEGLAGR
jgi:nitroreductase